jgi:ribose 5-phosphate isomerase A
MTAKPNDASVLGEQAVALVRPGMLVGLGTGRAAAAFIEALGRRVKAGLAIQGIPTSRTSAELAARLGIPLTEFGDQPIDVTFDGADEVDPQGNLIKGYGGALVREKIVAADSRAFVVLIGEEKLVPALGARGKLPVEVLTFGLPATLRHLMALGLAPQVRQTATGPATSDNGNRIVDCATGPIERASELEAKLLAIPGVVGTGLFLGMADRVLIQRGDRFEERLFPKIERPQARTTP